MSHKGTRNGVPIYTVDAFTDEPFRGNPAAVCLIPRSMKLSDETLQTIAAEINLTETAYIEHRDDDSSFDKSNKFNLRWFTPTDEITLCGHATLASAAVLMLSCGNSSEEICFYSMSGPLVAKRNADTITLDFPRNPAQEMDKSKVKYLLKALCSEDLVKDVQYSSKTKKLLVRLIDGMTRAEFEGLTPDYEALQQSNTTEEILEVIVTMKGSKDIVDKNGIMYDFVSRNFSPWVGIPEDPVTGSDQTVLADYWQQELGLNKFYARQCSSRGGEMTVVIKGDRVELSGKAQIIIKGELLL